MSDDDKGPGEPTPWTTHDRGWYCSAYGPQGGDLCFFGEVDVARCVAREQCESRMDVERERLYDRINYLALTESDPTWRELAAGLSGPGDLLAGD